MGAGSVTEQPMTLHLVALDPSVTSTGVCDQNGPRTIKGVGAGMARLARLRDEVRRAVIDADVVVIEGYSFGSPKGAANRAHQLGELGGVIRLTLHDLAVPHVDVPPANLKQFACGKGNASKEEVLTAAVRRLGYPGSSKDEADALWLYAMGAAHYLDLDVPVPAAHRAALVKVPWPVVPAQCSDGGGEEATRPIGKEATTNALKVPRVRSLLPSDPPPPSDTLPLAVS